MIAHDTGNISGEDYEIFLTYPHFTLEKNALEENFGKKANVVAQCLLSKPYHTVRNKKQITINLDGEQILLE